MLPSFETFLLPSLILFYGSSLQIGILVRQSRALTFWEEDQLGAERKRAAVHACFAFVERDREVRWREAKERSRSLYTGNH